MPQKSKLSLTIQYADTTLADVVTRPLLRRWAQAALLAPAELTLRFVDAAEGRALNREFRGKDYATNVLTFAYDDDAPQGLPDDEPTRADIVFCSAVLQQEAADQKKPLVAHAAHLVVHGVLHAQGYDHEDDGEAAEMEALEIEILAALGYPDPYLEDEAENRSGP